MRWTDLPPDGDPADAGGSALTRGEWEDLRERLERLPPGHPSRPEEADSAREDAADRDDADGPGPAAGRSVKDGERDRGPGARGHEAGRAAAAGRREPYRPWFTAGESPEPWFAADPEG
ncbi:MAG TPA: hypothetical protein VMI33_02845 [Streptosporangiaceae bacterium]|nr:hypothetical protein [Streptosporangiaceae bacterium]